MTTRASLKPLRMRKDNSLICSDWDDKRNGITLSTSLMKPKLHRSFRLLIRAIIAFDEILTERLVRMLEFRLKSYDVITFSRITRSRAFGTNSRKRRKEIERFDYFGLEID